MQETIPDWKRTAIASVNAEIAEENSLKKKVIEKIVTKFNETKTAKQIYESEQYKEYQDFKKEISQFKEDLKDHLGDSQNPAVIASMMIYVNILYLFFV